MLSICNSFSAEIEFETVLNDDRTVNKQLVHLKKSVGVNRTDIELKYGHNVSSIRRNVDVTELITAIKPRGHEEDGKITTITNVEKEIKDENGNVVFYTKKGSEYIYAPMANQEYGNPKRKGSGYIVGQFSYDTKSDTELFNRALTELEKKCVPAYEFEIEGFYDIDIGDTIRAIDEGYNPILLLEARISEQTISFSNPTKNKTVYSNYRILQNKVSQSLLDRIDEVKKYAEQVAKTYIFSISNVGSPMFKNGEGEVIFTAKIEKNNQDMTGEFTEFNWIKQKKDGSLDTIWNEAHKNFGKALTVKPSDFDDTATFSYEALQDSLSIGGASGVVTKVYDGEDGKTPIKGVDYFDGQDGTNGLSAYLHIRYSQNSNGNPMTENPANAKYIGVQASQNPNPSTVPADYMWAEFKGQDGIPGEPGANGQTSYLHIKYSNDGGQTFTGNGGEDVGTWMGQYVDFTQADSTDVKKYAWSKIKGEDGKDGADGIAGKDGVGLKYTVIKYSQNTSGTTAPNAGWQFIVPNLIKGQYLWTRTTWTYTDNSTETGYTVSYNAKDGNDGNDGIAGKDGVGIKSTAITYAVSSSGTAAPTSGWTTAVPTVAAGSFLWTKTAWTYTDSTTETGYSVAKMGEKGSDGVDGADGSDGKDGVGIASTAITYQASSDGTTAPTGPWLTTIPTVATNQYLWTRTVITYTNNTSSTAYSVGKMGANGANGVSVSSVVEEYYVSTSPTGQAGGSWSTTVPNNADPNLYVFRRMKTTLSNGNVSYTNPALIQGMTGIYPYIGPTQPANPKEGQQWWKSDASGNITDFLVYKSGSWQGQTIQQSILNIIALNAVTITGSNITGTVINGSEFINSGTFTDAGSVIEYLTKIKGPIQMEYNVQGTIQNGTFIINPRTIINSLYKDAERKLIQSVWSVGDGGFSVQYGNDTDKNRQKASLNYDGVYMEDYRLNSYGKVALRYQDLMTLPEVQLTPKTGFVIYGTDDLNKPTAKRQGRVVQLKGAFKNTAQLDRLASATMGTLPIDRHLPSIQSFKVPVILSIL